MEIRVLTAEDAGEWWRLRLEALESDPEAFSAAAEDHRLLSLDEVRNRLGIGHDDQFVVGAWVDGRLVGMAGFFRERGPRVRHKGRVWGVYVTMEQRGRGVGKQMMQAVIERASAIKEIEQVLLSVAATQEAAVHLYRTLGFVPFGREPRALNVGGRFIDEAYLILTLKKASQD